MEEKKPKLLVVDDEIDQCESIKNYFVKRNFLVFTAESGEEALAQIAKNKPDLALLDLKLAGSLTGKDVLIKLRSYDKTTKVVVVTGDILNEQQMREITDLGLAAFLSKPIEMKKLEAIINKILLESYPKIIHFKKIKYKKEINPVNLRRISHDLSNITGDIANKCELYILDTEEGLYKDKTEKERLDKAINILKSVLKQTERISDIVKRLSSLSKKEL